MNRLERADGGNLAELLRQAMANWQSDLWTALPGIVQSYDPTKQTCTVQPGIHLVRYPRDGSDPVPLEFPVLLDVPVVFPGGGGYSLTFPLAKGDEVLVVFASRGMDAWWYYGTANQKSQPQTELRMHDLSDGFAIVGPRSRPRVLSPNPSSNTVQIRSDDGAAYVEVSTPSPGNHNINIVTNGTTTVKAPVINLQNAGSALKKLVKDTFITLFNGHTHNVTAVGAPTGVPIQQSTTDTTTVVNAE